MKPGSAIATLGQIGRTGLLVPPLGGLIYLGASWMTGIDGAQFLLAVVLCLPMALLCLIHVVLALRSGSFHHGKTEVISDAEPVWFWGLVLFESGMAALLAWLGAWAAWQVL